MSRFQTLRVIVRYYLLLVEGSSPRLTVGSLSVIRGGTQSLNDTRSLRTHGDPKGKKLILIDTVNRIWKSMEESIVNNYTHTRRSIPSIG